MTSVFGYIIWLFAMVPELSMDVFFWLTGRGTRQHDVLEVFRFTVQTAANGTSPVKLLVMLGTVTGFLALRRLHPSRLASLGLGGLAAALGAAQLFFLSQSGGPAAAGALVPATISTFATFWWSVHQGLVTCPTR